MFAGIRKSKGFQWLLTQPGKVRLWYMMRRLAPRHRVLLLLNYLDHLAATVLGIALAGLVLRAELTGHVAAPQPGVMVGFFVAVGGMIGTVIVLVFTLSMIPIQRSADRFSPFVTQMYKDDLTPKVIFFVMALLCLLSFAFAVEGLVPVSGVMLAAIEIVLIGGTLDLIRWHQRRVSYLLEPQTAVNLLVARTLADIDKIVAESSRWAVLDKIVPGMKASPSFAAAVFHEYAPVKARTDNLAWIAHKAVENVEAHTASLAIHAMAQVVSHYLTSLQQNEIIRSSIPLLDVNSVRDRLRSVYEHLKDVNNNAVARNNETICIQVILALEAVASHAAMFDQKVFGKYDTTNVAIPLGYLNACADNAQRNNMHDAVLEASHALKRFAWTCMNHAKSLEIYAVVLEYWHKMALGFSLGGNRPLVNEVMLDMMALAHFLIARKYLQAKEMLSRILDTIESLVVLDLNAGGKWHLLSPFVPYDLMSPLSLIGLINTALATTDGEPQSKVSRTKDCSQLTRLLQPIERHFSSLANNSHIAATPAFFNAASTIEEILKTILHNLATNKCSEYEEQRLLDLAAWLLAFFWVPFSTAAKMGCTDCCNAENACDSLAYFGMAFHKKGFRDFAISAAKAIKSVIGSYCRTTPSVDPFHVADLLIFAYKIELAVRASGDSAAADEIEKVALCNKEVEAPIRKRINDSLNLRKAQLAEELKRDDRLTASKSNQLLRDILSQQISSGGPKDS